jgi:hypothetical protein
MTKANQANQQVRWVRVAYQPDLQHPKKVIPLGVVLDVRVDGWRMNTIAGRVARRDRRAADEFREIGTLGFDLLSGWFDAIQRDIATLYESDSLLEQLGARWGQNLYVTSAEEAELPTGDQAIEQKAEVLAKKLYAQHVGEPFPEAKPASKPVSTPPKARKPASTRPPRDWRNQKIVEVHAP